MPRPLKYSGVRAFEYETAKDFGLSRDEMREVITNLNKRELKARKEKAKRDAERVKREEERERQRLIELNKKIQEQLRISEEKRKARIARQNAKRKEQRRLAREAKQVKEYQVVWNITIPMRFKYEKDGEVKYTPWKIKREDFDRRITGSVEAGVKAITDAKVLQWETDSPLEVKVDKMKVNITSTTEIQRVPTDKKTIKMKKAFALDLDGEVAQEWDSGNGTCVYDFLIWRYGDKNGCKKVCTMERLDELFSKYKVPAGKDEFGNDKYDTIETNNAREEGVCVYQIINFCDAVGVRMYAMDENSTIIHAHEPRNINRKLTPVIYRIMNNHFYAVIDKAKSVSMMGKSKTSMEYEKKKDTDDDATVEEQEIVVVEPQWDENTNNIRVATMIKTMMNDETQVYPYTNMRFTEAGLASFTLNGKKYVFEEDDTIKNAQAIAKLNDKPYTGESTFNILLGMLDELKYTNKSVCNPAVFKSLVADGVKYRTHYGITDAQYKREDLERMVANGEAICADIAKCYTACLENAYDNWIQYDFNDEWTAYDGNLRTGLYFVETDDMTLMHGSNIYSNKIVELAIAEGIELTITKQLIPRNTLPADYYHNLLNKINEVCKGDKTLKKSLTNIITGFLGKHSTYRYYPKLTTDINTIWNDFNTPEYHQHETFMVKEGDYYLYGYKVPVQTTEVNVPMYIQILDWSNIRLYNMIKQSGGVCVFRKTDCAVIVGGALEYGTNNGDYRPSELPNVCSPMRPVEERCVECNIVEPNPWKLHPEITSSDQVDDVYAVLNATKGFLNVSRAGTGKTWNALQIEKKFCEEHGDSAKVIKLAFTNKACLNMGGTTIHKFLKIDKDGKFNMSWLKSLRNRVMLFIIDEISMIGKFLWRRLVELKKYLGNTSYFMLLGDYRQAPPVEQGEEEMDYFESSAVKYMSNNHKIEFIVRQRYDEALWDFAEDVYEREYTDYNKVRTIETYTPADLIKTTNICYYNNTRKHINAIVNKYVADRTADKYLVEYDAGEEQKPKQQTAYLYKGCPIIASVNSKKIDIINNETYTIKEIDDLNAVAVSQRLNENGEVEEHRVEFSTDEFHSYFLLNYCSTTHKQQGATIDNDIIIFDYECMSRELQYTAITRVKKLSQIIIKV